MSSLLKKVLDRESIVKSNLIDRLIETVKEIQLKYAAENGLVLTNDEMTNNLLWIIEAVFIHGLKNPFLKSIAFGHRDTIIPEPSFWEYVLIYCHQEVILQINSLIHIHTDIGRCRAWLRLTLNDGLLISYLQLMLSDNQTLKEYFKPNAFLRDSDRCDLMISFLSGIQSYEFNLAFKSSILNSWNSYPLSLVGLWNSPNETICQGIDIASNMDDKDLQQLPQLTTQTPPKGFSVFDHHRKPPLLDEDEALRVILESSGSRTRSSGGSTPTYNNLSRVSSRRNSDSNKQELLNLNTNTPSTSNSSTYCNSNSNEKHRASTSSNSCNNIKKSTDSTAVNTNVPAAYDEDTITSIINIKNIVDTTKDLNLRSSSIESGIILSDEAYNTSSISTSTRQNEISSISAELDELNDNDRNNSSTNSKPKKDQMCESFSSENLSYEALFNSYEKNNPLINTMAKFDQQITATSSAINNFRLEVENSSSISLEKEVSSSDFFAQMDKVNQFLKVIPKEAGLFSQNYKCKKCDRPIGMIYGQPRICSFTGFYFCSDCHFNDEYHIPSRIIFNWDFKVYPISRDAKNFLQDVQDQPTFNLNELNCKIYSEIEELRELRDLRTKLKLIAKYLKTCKDPKIMKNFERDIQSKPYLYEETHLFSYNDLLLIPNRFLATLLIKLISLGQTHILSCDFCKLKAFICEICKSSKLIFPFDLENIFKCSLCGAVYHSICMNKLKPCPRCERFRLRKEESDKYHDDENEN